MAANKKDWELQCLQKVIEVGKRSRGQTKLIVNMLDGKDLVREYDERPDFVREVRYARNSTAKTVIGIEHFMVDHYALLKKDGKVASKSVLQKKGVTDTIKKWKPIVTETDSVPKAAINEIANLAANQLKLHKQATYDNFMRSFEYSLEKHVQSVDAYRENIRKFATGRIEIAFLIEIHSDFHNIFLNDAKGTRLNPSGITPFFTDIVKMLEAVDKRKVNYLVLCFGPIVYADKVDIVALRTGDIAKQLRKQNIKQYEYAGDDCLLNDFQPMNDDVSVNPSFDLDGEKVNMKFEYSSKTISKEDRISFIFYAARKAQLAQQNKQNFVTSTVVQSYLEGYGKYVVGWKPKVGTGDNWRIEPIYQNCDKAICEKAMDDFARKWGILSE